MIFIITKIIGWTVKKQPEQRKKIKTQIFAFCTANFITFAENIFSNQKINRIMKKVLFVIIAVVFFVKS
ncbi:MAG: hypothetical protein LBH82_06405, partial [Bacteroidales bacterium]|nr:hypothetical protein [Bacteroidales bacterium]